jgi:hypothetical protein
MHNVFDNINTIYYIQTSEYILNSSMKYFYISTNNFYATIEVLTYKYSIILSIIELWFIYTYNIQVLNNIIICLHIFSF